MALTKETKIKLAFIGLIIIGIGGYTTIVILKAKKAESEKVKGVEDPSIKNKTEYGSMGEAERNNLMEKVDSKDKKVSVDSSKIKKVDSSKKTRSVVKEEKKEVKTEKVENNIQEKLQEKVDQSLPKKVVVKEEKKEKKEEIPNVKFNFVIVKDDDLSSENVRVQERGSMGAKDDVKLFKGKVYGVQKVKSSEPVMVRNTEEFVIYKPKKVTIPTNSIFNGTCKLAGNRLYINLTSTSTMNGDYPVDIDVYDSDFIKGIFIKEGIETGVEESGNTIVEDASGAIPNQLAGAVVRTTSRAVQRSLAKQEKISVTLQDGYEIMLGVTNLEKKK